MTYPTPKGGNMSPNPLKKNFKQKKMNKWKNSD